MIDFPASPTNGQLFSASNGGTYQWNGTFWLPIGNTAATIWVGDTPPASPIANQFWFNSALGQTFLWYNDGNTTQWVPANPQQLGPPAAQSIMLSDVTASAALATTSTPISWGTVDYNSTGGTYSIPNFTIPVGAGGVWDVDISLQVQGATTWVLVQLIKNGVNLKQGLGTSNTTGTNVAVSGRFVFAVGDIIRAQAMAGIAGVNANYQIGSWMHLTRIGA